MRHWLPSERDVEILLYVYRLRHVTTAQIQALVFPGLTSRTQPSRRLNILVENGYLARTKHDTRAGGGGYYVYRLLAKGWHMVCDDTYRERRDKVYHSLDVGDLVVELYRLQRAGVISLVGIDYEPENWTVVGGVKLHPDLYTHVRLRDGRELKLWVEVDRSTEALSQVRGHLFKYRNAYDNYGEADVEAWPEFPRCLWVVPDEHRVRNIRRQIDDMAEEHQRMFRVKTLKTVENIFI